jgi:hypothetical protein
MSSVIRPSVSVVWIHALIFWTVLLSFIWPFNTFSDLQWPWHDNMSYLFIYLFIYLLVFFISFVKFYMTTDRWFSPGPPVSSTNKTDRHDITEILLKVALNTIKQTTNICPFKVLMSSVIRPSVGVVWIHAYFDNYCKGLVPFDDRRLTNISTKLHYN